VRRVQIVSLLGRLRLPVVDSTPYGITIQRHRASTAPLAFHLERWRIEPCSGIGRPGEFALQKLSHGLRLGPFSTLGGLERALRAWRRWDF